jgi:creatinine amidohydrolase
LKTKSRNLQSFIILTAVVLLAGPAPADEPKGNTPSNRVRPPEAGVYRLEDLNTTDVARIDREKTYFLQPIGMIHPHGPHLPGGTDNIIAEALIEKTAERLRRDKPEYTVLIGPLLPIGTGPSNEIGYIYAHPAAVTAGSGILRDFLVDWVVNFSANGWWNFAFVSFHHDPGHLRVLSEVCDFYYDAYGLNSVNLTSVVLADSTFRSGMAGILETPAGADPLHELHGGQGETSLLLSIDPDRVDPVYRDLVNFPTASWSEMTTIARRFGWPYYFGAPSKASAEQGEKLLDLLADYHARHLVKAMETRPRVVPPLLEEALEKEFDLREVVRGSVAQQSKARAKYRAWLRHLETEREKANAAPPDSSR